MSLSKNWLSGIMLAMAVLNALCGEGRAQAWQDPSTSDNGTTATDWNQRVLKRTQRSQWEAKWQDGRSSASSTRAAESRSPVRHVSYDSEVFDSEPAPQVIPTPRPQPMQPKKAEIVEPDAMQFEPMASGGAFGGSQGCASCGGVSGDCDTCDVCEGAPCGDTCDLGWEVFDGRCGPLLRGLSVFAGADAFKGSVDRGSNGNFGLNEGLNLARPLGDPWGCGFQIGANFVQSDFSGTRTVDIGENHHLNAAMRKQYFTTAGIFRRADPCGGLQWGVAYDYMHDVYYENANLQQIRSETGWVIDSTYEIGYYGAYGVGTDRIIDGRLDATDMFVCYMRRNFENGGNGRLWGGATGNGDGLLGVDLWVPLGRGFALENRLNYMIPKQGTGPNAQSRESWGFVVQLVWYPGQNAKCQQQNPYRAMFNVADNSLFMVDRVEH